jgi:hypothetical protein
MNIRFFFLIITRGFLFILSRWLFFFSLIDSAYVDESKTLVRENESSSSSSSSSPSYLVKKIPRILIHCEYGLYMYIYLHTCFSDTRSLSLYFCCYGIFNEKISYYCIGRFFFFFFLKNLNIIISFSNCVCTKISN